MDELGRVTVRLLDDAQPTGGPSGDLETWCPAPPIRRTPTPLII
jgi:hypothetical protein